MCAYVDYGQDAGYIAALPVVFAVSYSPREAMLHHAISCAERSIGASLAKRHFELCM